MEGGKRQKKNWTSADEDSLKLLQESHSFFQDKGIKKEFWTLLHI